MGDQGEPREGGEALAPSADQSGTASDTPSLVPDDGGELPAAPEEPTAGMESVGPVAPQESQEAEPAPAADEEVEVIKRDEMPPQTVRIFRTWGTEVVVVEEEKANLEVKCLCSTLNNYMKKIEVS